MGRYKNVESKLKLAGQLMEIHEESSFKIKAINNASFQLSRFNGSFEGEIVAQLQKLPGIGESLAKSILSILNTGSFPELDALIEKTPPGVIDFFKIKGLGAVKIETIWKQMGIEDVGELEYACIENQITRYKGFGAKTQQNILEQIDFLKSTKKQFLFSEGIAIAEELMEVFFKNVSYNKLEFTGQLRRKCLILDKIEFILQAAAYDIIEAIKLAEIQKYDVNENWIIFIYKERFPVHIFCSSETTFYKNQFILTGSAFHISQLPLDEKINYTSEEQIYAANKIPFCPVELRDDENQFNWVKQNDINDLITQKDIKGIIHAHTTYSDGSNTLMEMAMACIEQGYEYLCVSDHSQSAKYARGLSTDIVIEQLNEIDLLNIQLAPFKIFKGIESDILSDGSLDYNDQILQKFDFVIASIHSNLKMIEEKAMNRLLNAIENPYTTILGHTTGRLLLSRKGYPVNHHQLIDACAKNHVSIELNASPHRLDIDYQYLQYAQENQVNISINPDAHDIAAINNVRFGVTAARKGCLVKKMCLNFKSKSQLENYFLLRKEKKGVANL
jgi:DNA polymerase (family 10)